MAVVSCREPCMHAPLYCPLHAGHECALAHSSHSSTVMHACVMTLFANCHTWWLQRHPTLPMIDGGHRHGPVA